MNIRNFVFATSSLGMLAAFAAGGSIADKPTGFRFFNQHLTIKPYVSVAFTYDSNIDSTKSATHDGIFLVSPGADFMWHGDRWELTGNVWYRYNAYCENNSDMGENSYGQALSYAWSTSSQGERGWSLLLSENYIYTSQSDDLTDGGRGIWRDRERINFSGALERRITERWHADLQGGYNYLDYKNNGNKYAPLYGWSSYSGGLSTGYAFTKWTDLLIAGGYTHYNQDDANASDLARHYSNDSQSYTVQGGIGTHATERIKYSLLAGASWFNYGGRNNCDASGWTYTASANWRVSRQLQFSLLGSSYYRPSERSLGTAVKVYTMSGGFSYLTMGDKMNINFNIAYNHTQNVYADANRSYMDYDYDHISTRLGATYTINRWVSVFGHIQYMTELNDKHDDYDYDRFRGTIGLRFHY